METIKFGRRKFTVVDGKTKLLSTSITVRAFKGEDEQAFFERLKEMCGNAQGFMEIIFKAGCPDYAIITYSQEDEG